MIGRSNARRGARRIFTVLQNRRLNQHIAYTVMDEVGFKTLVYIQKFDNQVQLFIALFPEIVDDNSLS